VLALSQDANHNQDQYDDDDGVQHWNLLSANAGGGAAKFGRPSQDILEALRI
jgi:hypothetical protein